MDALALARETLNGLLEDARSTRHPPGGASWTYVDGRQRMVVHPWLYHGTAGVAYVLCLGFEVVDDPRYLNAARAGAEWLCAKQPGQRGPYSGLWVGEGGVAALCLRVARATGEARWLEEARARARWAAARPIELTELLFGAGGLGLVLLDLHGEDGDPSWIERARAQAAFLEETGGAGPCAKWEIEPGRAEGRYWPGLGHGAAGIALFLLELSRRDAAQGARWGALAARAARWLEETALEVGGQVAWPRIEGRPNDHPVQWCHGPPGIGLFFARAWALTGEERYLDWARRCGEATLAAGDVRENPCFCHGLLGNADLLVELGRLTGEARWDQAIDALLWPLERYRIAEGGVSRWRSDDRTPTVRRKGWATGSAGVAYGLLRIAAADRIGLPLLEPRVMGS